MFNKKAFLILIIVLVILIGGYFLLFPTKSVNHSNVNTDLPFDLNNDFEVQIRDMTNVPPKYYSGNSRFSHGECQKDTDCHVIGCLLEMCSSDPDLMTTCEILGETPDKTKYACGCIKDRCGWYLK